MPRHQYRLSESAPVRTTIAVPERLTVCRRKIQLSDHEKLKEKAEDVLGALIEDRPLRVCGGGRAGFSALSPTSIEKIYTKHYLRKHSVQRFNNRLHSYAQEINDDYPDLNVFIGRFAVRGQSNPKLPGVRYIAGLLMPVIDDETGEEVLASHTHLLVDKLLPNGGRLARELKRTQDAHISIGQTDSHQSAMQAVRLLNQERAFFGAMALTLEQMCVR